MCLHISKLSDKVVEISVIFREEITEITIPFWIFAKGPWWMFVLLFKQYYFPPSVLCYFYPKYKSGIFI